MKKPHPTLLLTAALLLLAACGTRHEVGSIDTSLVQTDDSMSFDVCSDWHMRNIMAVLVDSTGAISLNHDVLDITLPPPPPGEEAHVYVDDRVPTDLGQLRKQVKRFLANNICFYSIPIKAT